MQRGAPAALATLEGLIERGLVEVRGHGRGRRYTLAARVYVRQGRKVEYTRQAGFDRLQHEQLVLGFVRQHGKIRRSDAMELCFLNGNQASLLLRRMKEKRLLEAHGQRRWTYYTAVKD